MIMLVCSVPGSWFTMKLLIKNGFNVSRVDKPLAEVDSQPLKNSGDKTSLFLLLNTPSGTYRGKIITKAQKKRSEYSM